MAFLPRPLPSLNRRDFLARSATATAALGAVMRPWWKAVAGPFDAADFERLVPRDKRLSAEWLRSLTTRGEATVARGTELSFIGMPIGGIACGQLYLGGDGRLWHWDIFNLTPPPDYGDYRGPHYAHPLKPASPITQGFALWAGPADSATPRPLDSTGFREISFRGEYPVGHVEYHDPDCPVDVTLEAFSPFIPLNAEDSALPLTVMEFTVHNPGKASVEIALAGWLENATCLESGRAGRGERVNDLRSLGDGWFLDCRAVPAPPEPARERRPDLVIDDFERDTYAPWTATGTAFGTGPVKADAMPEYQGKVGAQGDRLVNSHASAPADEVGARDAATGTLTSAPFLLERDYINFLVGGGSHRGKTCLNLVVDDRIVASTTGDNDNRLRPKSWDVRPWAGKSARIQIVDAEPGAWGNIGVDRIVLGDVPVTAEVPLEREEDFGTLGLGLLGRTRGDFGFRRIAADAVPGAAMDAGRGDLPANPRRGARPSEEVRVPFGSKLVGALGRRLTLRPGRRATFTFLVAWHFPAVRRASLSHVTDIAKLRRAYANRFASAFDVARYGAGHFERLAGETRLWRRTWYDDSTLPHWFLERTFANVSILSTATCHWFDSGRFYGWEGTYCCAGTCQHVWQYAHAVGRVFPSLERSVREYVDYGLAFHPDTGAIDYRAEAHRVVAIDGQAGTILRAYREHQTSPDDAYLRRLWPRIRRSIEHLVSRDRDEDGILDGEQYNTLDASWYGEIAWLSSLYCAAVRAGAAMAREVGDEAFALKCEAIAERGSRRITERLFDGEYYVQKVDPAHAEHINTNAGCHIDQVYGQSWAFQVGLPRVLPTAETRRALHALWQYNFTPDVGVYRDGFATLRGGRWYAMPGEGGLLMCTWPKGGAERAAGKGDPTFVGYFNECMTGFEYQVAAHMVWEGGDLTEKGLAITRMIHDRYHPSKRNPYNEVECSSHYARAMASHGVYLAASGFEYHGPKGHLGFAPRVSAKEFRGAFTAAEGWGTYAQREGDRSWQANLEVRWGRLRIQSLALAVPAGYGRIRVAADGREVPATVESRDGRTEIRLAPGVTLTAGRTLQVVATPG